MKIQLHDFAVTASTLTEDETKKFKTMFEALDKVEKERVDHESSFRKAVTKLFTDFDKKQNAIKERGIKIASEIEDFTDETDSELLESQEEQVNRYLDPESSSPRTAQFILPRSLIGLRLVSNERRER